MSVLAVEGLCKAFTVRRGWGPWGDTATIHAVREVSFSAEPGELLVLVGPSGCGKTTTLRLIAGLDRPTHGTVRIAGTVVNDTPPHARDVAMVFQSYALYPHMTVYRNLAFGLRMRGTAGPEVDRRVRETAEMLGIDHLLDRRPHQLSGGEQQRVAVGRAVVRKPRVFLLDEPLSNLDAQLRERMRVELKALHRELGVTAVYVTHDQGEAMTLADRIVVLRGGTVQQMGTPTEVYRRPVNRFVAGFLGSPSMNLLSGRLESKDGTLWFVGADTRLPLHARFAADPLPDDGSSDDTGPRHPSPAGTAGSGRASPAVLGIRPQHLSVRLNEPGEGRSGESPRGARTTLCRAVVRLTEYLGDAVHVHLQTTSGVSLVARSLDTPGAGTAQELVSRGRHVDVEVDPSQVHVFSADGDGRRWM